MASASAFAQHYVECDNCEKNSAQFVCKTCSGHLCEECKIDHENRKLTKNHEITAFKTDKGELLGLLHCSEHNTKKLECFCGPCKKPVCTDCIVSSHNGHKIKSLSTAYKEIRDDLQGTKVEIEYHFLPKYMELLDKEIKKEISLSTEANQIETHIEAYTQKVVEAVLKLGENAIRKLRMEEDIGQKEIQKSKVELLSKINRLQETRDMLTTKLDAKPGLSFFVPITNLLKEFQKFPEHPEYKLDDFKPGQISQRMQENFGTLPKLRTIQQGSNFLDSGHFTHPADCKRSPYTTKASIHEMKRRGNSNFFNSVMGQRSNSSFQ
uniref:Tripartite motif-containing protein 45-like n=1 Tax=Crassostrea virginica TaxID=6565 RepID=A0A8B8C9D3_CRAVI|nr:tripartite motif-containing protein 45-like [Crassostrea virginica]